MSATVTATVVLVDDDKTILDSLRHQLRAYFGYGLACETAEGAAEAWEVIEELMAGADTRVILVVTDWLMPEVKGDEFLEDVMARYPGIHRVMLTGQADAEVLERVQRLGVVEDVLHKPWSPEDLRAIVSRSLAA